MDTDQFYLACHKPDCRRVFVTKIGLRLHLLNHPRYCTMDQKEIRTEDGVIVRKGDVVFNYYDQWWGRIAEDPDNDGWFHVDGTSDRRLLNGARIASYDPKGSRPPAELTRS